MWFFKTNFKWSQFHIMHKHLAWKKVTNLKRQKKEVEWRKMKEADDSVLSRQESLQSAFVVISNVITTTKYVLRNILFL